jgi:hypothetical protein
VLLRLLNKLSLPPNRPPRLLLALPRRLEDLRLAVPLLPPSKPPRLRLVLPRLLVKPVKLLLRLLKHNVCKYNLKTYVNTTLKP